MKNLYPFFLLISFIGSAQNTVLYSENFDGPAPYKVQNFHLQNGLQAPNIFWDTVSNISNSGPRSYKVKGTATSSEIWFETNSFSTVGYPYIQLKFSHIAKIYLPNQGRVEYSLNGTTWNPLPSSSYLGSQLAKSALYTANQYFNSGSYVLPSQGANHWASTSNIPATNLPWADEVFDLRGVANDPVTFQGYPNVKLRFKANFNFTTPAPAQNFYDGWYIDDIQVIGSNCSATPSQITFDIGSNPFIFDKPEGNIPANITGNYKVSLTATNPDGPVHGVKLIYDVNGVIDTVSMFAVPNTTDQFSYDIGNLLVGDTIKWHVQASLANCAFFTSSPYSGNYQFQIIEPYPSKCGTVFLDQSPYVINSFPWLEDFESTPWIAGTGSPSISNTHRGVFASYPSGNWTVSPNTTSSNATTYAWGVGKNIIPGNFGLTGPSGNHTPGGTNYLYTSGNFNSPVSGSTVSSTRITSPCIQLDSNKNLGFEFWYHAFGQDIGTLRIDIDTGTSNTSWYNNYFNVIGEQQTSPTDPWKKIFVHLLPFKGKTIKIRINSRKLSSGPQAFMAIDDLSVYEFIPEQKDIKMDKAVQPQSLSCSFSNTEPIQFRYFNNGIDTLTTIPFAYQIDANPIIRDTLFHIGLLPFAVDTFLFSQSADLATPKLYTIKMWSELVGDTVYSNDTLFHSISSSYSISSFPFIESFESSTSATSGTGNSIGALNSNLFTLNDAANSPNGPIWKIYNNAIRKVHHGPLGGAQREGNFLLYQNESTSINALQAIFKSSCIDFSTLLNPQMAFHYHNFSSNTSLQVEFKEVGSSVWQLLGSYSASQTSKSEAYKVIQIDLSQFAGKIVQMRFLGNRTTSVFTNMAIDNLRFFERKNHDYGLVTIEDPGYRISAGIKTKNVSFSLINQGLASNSRAMVFKMQLTEICALTNPNIITGQTNLFTDLAAYRQSKSISKLMTFSDSLKPGRYRLKAWIEVAGDPVSINDTVERDILIVEDQTIPYFNDFEGCDAQFFSSGDILDWEIGDATKSGWTGAKSGQNTWITHRSENGILSNEKLALPIFTGFDSIYDAEIRFWQNYDFGPSPGYGSVEYNDGGIWRSFQAPNGIGGINWNVQFDPINQLNTFRGTSSGWIYSTYPLNQFNKSANPLAIRFNASYENSPGWAIDDFEIFIPLQNSSSPTQMLFQSSSLPVNGNNPIKVRVLNSGHAPLDKFELKINVNGNVSTENFTLTNPIIMGQMATVNITNSIVLTSGVNNVEIISLLPNNKMDEKTNDDTLSMVINVLNVVNSLPYCTDFEQNGEFANYDTKNSISDTNWIYGLPTKLVLNSTHSGTKSWFTSNANYFPQQDQYLFTNEFEVNKNQCYELSFWHQFYTEYNNDGAMMEYTVDTGKTWITLGSFNDSNWYNTPYIQSLDAINPGWSGLSNGWEKVTNTIQFFDTTKVQFRFRFATSSIIHHEGWAIDDFCFEPLQGSCSFIGQKEELVNQSSLDLFPNPTQNELNIIYHGALHGEATIRIVNSLGQVVKSSNHSVLPGERMTIPTENFAKGLFVLLIEFKSGEQISEPFEKL